LRTRYSGIGLAIGASALVVGCATVPSSPKAEREAKAASSVPAPQRRGGYYLDDGPGDNPPPDLDKVPDAAPRPEALHRYANNPYVVFGKEYVPARDVRPFKQRGLASWYGRRFQGGRTSSGEPYDMYAMSAAHPTLPIPSYARVTNIANGRVVVVRINDRGPFFPGRIIDLSYAAASKLGYVENGHALVEVEAIVPGEASPASRAPRSERAGQAADTKSVDGATPPDAISVPLVTEAGAVYVQLAAFSARENAENLRARLLLELGWLTQPLSIVAGDGLYRLRAGPFEDRSQAANTAQRIRLAVEVAPVIVGK